jgi:hypothetical protein
LGCAAVERALPCGNLIRPARRAALRRGRSRRQGGELRRGELRRRCRPLRRLLWRRIADLLAADLLAADLLGRGAAFGDHLIEPAVETRQRTGDPIRCVRICGTGRCEERSESGLRILCGRRRWRRAVHDRRGRHWLRRVVWLRRVLYRLLRRLRSRLRRRHGLADASSHHALELPGQVIETVVYGREAIIDVLVLDTLAV